MLIIIYAPSGVSFDTGQLRFFLKIAISRPMSEKRSITEMNITSLPIRLAASSRAVDTPSMVLPFRRGQDPVTLTSGSYLQHKINQQLTMRLTSERLEKLASSHQKIFTTLAAAFSQNQGEMKAEGVALLATSLTFQFVHQGSRFLVKAPIKDGVIQSMIVTQNFVRGRSSARGERFALQLEEPAPMVRKRRLSDAGQRERHFPSKEGRRPNPDVESAQ